MRSPWTVSVTRAAVVATGLLLSACGSVDGTSGTGGQQTTSETSEAATGSTAETTSADETASGTGSASGTGDGSATGTGTDGEGEGADPTLAGGSEAVLDLVLGRLDSATLDGRSQCLLAPDDVGAQAGLALSLRPHMLSDGHDVWVVCLTRASGPEGSTLSLTDSAGVVWGEGVMARLPESESERSIGFGLTGTSVRGVTVADGESLVPVGFSYRRGGLTVTTLVMEVPTARPLGAWTVAVTGPDGSEQVQVDTPACRPGTAAPVTPWPVRVDRQVVTFVELNAWLSDPDPDLVAGFEPVDHCLATPLLHGLQWEQAVGAVQSAREAAGLPQGEISINVTCEDGAAGTVQWQQPPPNGLLTDPAHLDVHLPCPPMPDLVGLSRAAAEEALVALSAPPTSFRAQASPGCTGADSLVSRTWPPAAETSYLSQGSTLLVDLFCDPGQTDANG